MLVLPCFSKILGHIMYDRLYTYFNETKIIFEEHFGLRAAHSTDHALLDQI